MNKLQHYAFELYYCLKNFLFMVFGNTPQFFQPIIVGIHKRIELFPIFSLHGGIRRIISIIFF